MSDEPSILVVGSINMDLAVRSPHMPAPGETVLGRGFTTSPGGKGANQAVAAARLGARVAMIGRLGGDPFGRTLRAGLRAEGVDDAAVLDTPDEASGVALIVVDAAGENAIVVAPGANGRLTPDDVFACQDAFATAEVVLLQLELPLPTVRAALDMARRHGTRVVLDPAPARKDLPAELYKVDIFSPNVSEAEILTGVQAVEERLGKRVALELLARGARAAVLKLSQRGALVVTADSQFYTVPAYRVTVQDSTGAGDAFTAALAVATARGEPLREATAYANAAGALACTALGAQAALPTDEQVRLLMHRQTG